MALDEVLGGTVTLGIQTDGFQQPPQTALNRGVVVDDVYRAAVSFGRSSGDCSNR